MNRLNDIASRLDSLKFGGTTFASNPVYNAASQVESLNVGSFKQETYVYDQKTGLLFSQQVTQGGATNLSLSYNYTLNRDSLIDPTHGEIPGTNPPGPLASLPRTGVYIIIATPFETNKTGAYTLSLNKLAGFGFEAETTVDQTAPGRQIRDNRGRAAEFGGTTFERFGRRRIVKQ